MSNTTEKLAKSLSAESIELIPYLSYLLQDLWELGSSPKDMIELITKHVQICKQTRVLDLACGKGAVSIHIAKEFGCKVKGIDLIPEFIDYSIKKAEEFDVFDLCEFVVGDIIQLVRTEKHYDIVILGAVGDVLGNAEETLELLKQTLKSTGYILIDDAYGDGQTSDATLTKKQWLDLFDRIGLEFVEDKIIAKEEVVQINQEQQKQIIKRANELKERLPEKISIFDSYIDSQQSECDLLENELLGVTMLLKVRN